MKYFKFNNEIDQVLTDFPTFADEINITHIGVWTTEEKQEKFIYPIIFC